jgi:VanZ family protein
MRTDRTVRTGAALASIAWAAVIFGLSSLPGSAVPGKYGALGHFGVYAVLGALLLLALPRERRPWVALVTAVALASIYGITDEFHQSFVPGRVPDIADWFVDTAGALTSTLLLELTRRLATRRQ